MPLFWRQASPKPNGTFSSGNTLVDLSGTIQLDRAAERGAQCRFCLPPSDGITTWSSGGRLTAYIYHRSCLIRLGSLYPIALRRKALAAHSLRNLITHWCNLNKPKPLKTGGVNHMAGEHEKVSPAHYALCVSPIWWSSSREINGANHPKNVRDLQNAKGFFFFFSKSS